MDIQTETNEGEETTLYIPNSIITCFFRALRPRQLAAPTGIFVFACPSLHLRLQANLVSEAGFYGLF